MTPREHKTLVFIHNLLIHMGFHRLMKKLQKVKISAPKEQWSMSYATCMMLS